MHARVRIGPIEKDIELSLVDRGKMIFRMLIGGSALAHDFLVDTGRRYLLTQPRRVAGKKKRKASLRAGPAHPALAGSAEKP